MNNCSPSTSECFAAPVFDLQNFWRCPNCLHLLHWAFLSQHHVSRWLILWQYLQGGNCSFFSFPFVLELLEKFWLFCQFLVCQFLPVSFLPSWLFLEKFWVSVLPLRPATKASSLEPSCLKACHYSTTWRALIKILKTHFRKVPWIL